jgi:bilin biosynthesis protein
MSSVDRFIASVNEQIELLTFDEPDADLLRQLVAYLSVPRQATRLQLIDLLTQIGEPATPFLLESLAQSLDPAVRKACCHALTNLGDPDSVPDLITVLLTDDDIEVRVAAAGALAKVGEPAFAALKDLLASDSVSESCKGQAAWAIASMCEEVSDQLYDNTSHPSATVRIAMLGAIAQLAQKQKLPTALNNALSRLTEALNDASSEVRIEAIANLARLKYPTAYSLIAPCLQDVIADVRKAATLALVKLGNAEAIEAIAPLQQDADPAVQRIAALAIDQLKRPQNRVKGTSDE